MFDSSLWLTREIESVIDLDIAVYNLSILFDKEELNAQELEVMNILIKKIEMWWLLNAEEIIDWGQNIH